MVAQRPHFIYMIHLRFQNLYIGQLKVANHYLLGMTIPLCTGDLF